LRKPFLSNLLNLRSCTHRCLFVGEGFVVGLGQPTPDQIVDNVPDLRLQAGALDGILQGVAHVVGVHAGIADQLLQLLVDGLVALGVLDGRDDLGGHVMDAGILQLLHGDPPSTVLCSSALLTNYQLTIHSVLISPKLGASSTVV